MTVRITLRRRAPARHGHPWIRRDDAARVMGPPDPRALAEVSNHKGVVLGWATYAPDARHIVARMISRSTAAPDEDWLEQALENAIHQREPLAAMHTGLREVNAEGDGLPGLVIDRFGEDRVIQVTTAFMAANAPRLRAWLRGYAGETASLYVLRPARAAGREGFDPGFDVEPGRGRAVDSELGDLPPLEWTENGLSFACPPPPSQKTGAYHDQRENRRRVAELAQAKGPLLDVGCHVGGFAVHALARGVQAIGLDSSARVLEFARTNAAAVAETDRDGAPPRHAFVRGDMFSPMQRALGPAMASLDIDRFGVIVFDPPKVASSPRDLGRASQAMARSIAQLLPLLRDDGVLIVCSCSHALDADGLDAIVERSGRDAPARGLVPLLVHADGSADPHGGRWGPGDDHPVDPKHPEGHYLRVNAYRFAGSR
jgi:23S rRNA (cytosine1962-C5)-methyltransferase